MPQLEDPKIQRIYLPSTEGRDEPNKLYIDYREQMTISDLMVYDQSVSELENAIRMLSCIIVAWNITDKENNSLPIDPNTIGSLPAADLKALIAIVEKVTPSDLGIGPAEKKT